MYQVFMWWTVLDTLGQKISKIRQEKFWTYQVFICEIVLNILKYTSKDKGPQKIRQEKNDVILIWQRFLNYWSLCVSKWLDIHQGFWTNIKLQNVSIFSNCVH